MAEGPRVARPTPNVDSHRMSDGEDGVQVVLGRAGEGQITFLEPVVMTDGSRYTRVPILLQSPGLTAESAIELEGWGGWTTGLVTFFDAMAAEWRGWDGVREWRDDGGSQTDRIMATHDGLGTVELRISTSPKLGWTDGEGNWTIEVVVPVDPGALEAAASGLRRLLGGLAPT